MQHSRRVLRFFGKSQQIPNQVYIAGVPHLMPRRSIILDCEGLRWWFRCLLVCYVCCRIWFHLFTTEPETVRLLTLSESYGWSLGTGLRFTQPQASFII